MMWSVSSVLVRLVKPELSLGVIATDVSHSGWAVGTTSRS